MCTRNSAISELLDNAGENNASLPLRLGLTIPPSLLQRADQIIE
jgi:hypothetical protein